MKQCRQRTVLCCLCDYVVVFGSRAITAFISMVPVLKHNVRPECNAMLKFAISCLLLNSDTPSRDKKIRDEMTPLQMFVVSTFPPAFLSCSFFFFFFAAPLLLSDVIFIILSRVLLYNNVFLLTEVRGM